MATSASVQDLRGALSHVRWIGGGSAAGKSTIAQLLAGTAWEIAGKTSDPPRAQANLLERDRLFTAQLDSCVHELDLPYVRIDGSEGIESVASRREASLGLMKDRGPGRD